MQRLNDSTKPPARFLGHCTIRALLLGAGGSAVITTSSMYVALKLGSLPWPTIFVAVMSMAILKLLKHTDLNEINVTHTAMSAGSMVAGGLAFTVPAIWIIDKHAQVSFVALLAVTLSGAVLGILFTAYLRPVFIEERKLPFPIGKAAAETLLAGDAGGSKAKILFSSMGIAAIFVALRDGLKIIPNAWTWPGLAAKNIFVGLLVSPMACAIGYIIGPLYTGVWFLGAVISHLIIVPVGISSGWFADLTAANAFKDSLGIGSMIGAGLGLLLKVLIDRTRRIYERFLNRAPRTGNFSFKYRQLLFLLAGFLFTLFTGMGVWAGVVTLLGVWLTTTMAAAATGQTGINPMEIFGILVLLAARVLTSVGGIEALLISGIVAVACGISGDVLNDFKSGSILKTDPRAQIIAETVGGLVGAVAAVIALLAMLKAFGTFGPGCELIAPQAYAVSTMLQGLPDAIAFWIGLAIGLGMNILNIPGITLGLGIFLPMTISASVFFGGIAGLVLKRLLNKIIPGFGRDDKFSLVAAGMLGGEGIAGVTIAIIRVLTMA